MPFSGTLGPDPTTISTAGAKPWYQDLNFAALFGGIGSGLQSVASAQQSYSRVGQLATSAAEATTNAALVRTQAAIGRDLSSVEMANIGLAAAQERGAARTSFAAGNVQLDVGEAASFEQALAASTERRRQATKTQSDIQQHSLGIKEKSLLLQAKNFRSASKQAKRAANIGAFASTAANIAPAFL